MVSPQVKKGDLTVGGPPENIQSTYGIQTKIEKYRYIFIMGKSHQTILPAYIS
jgi:hypothetical protein